MAVLRVKELGNRFEGHGVALEWDDLSLAGQGAAGKGELSAAGASAIEGEDQQGCAHDLPPFDRFQGL
jgi:hypothetical protein